jgi:hypothetical protein
MPEIPSLQALLSTIIFLIIRELYGCRHGIEIVHVHRSGACKLWCICCKTARTTTKELQISKLMTW